MTEQPKSPPGGDKAKDLAEQAVQSAIEGDADKARDLAQKAKSIDPNATRTVADEIEKDRRDAEKHQRPE